MPEIRRRLISLLDWDERGEKGDGRSYRFEDARAGADDICTAEFFRSNVEHAL